LDADKRRALEKLRREIKAAAPRAEECISYGVPGFRVDGRLLCSYAASAKHCAFYPGSIVQQFRKELKDYDTAKGTIRFAPEEPLPAGLVKKIIKARIKQRAKVSDR